MYGQPDFFYISSVISSPLLDEKMNAMQYCNTASERERCQYYSLLPKKAIRFSGSMFLSSSDILS